MEEKWWQAYVPKSVICLREKYTFFQFRHDLVAGMTVGMVSLPLALAFAIASGVGPERGLFTAVIAGFLISLLGGSRVQIGGPAGAFVVIVYGIIQRHGYEGLVIATLMASVLLVVMGLCRLGNLIKYFPQALLTGLTAGLGVIVFSLQVKDFFGLPLADLPVEFIQKWRLYFNHLAEWHGLTTALGVGVLGVIVLLRRYAKIVPWGIGAIIVATAVTMVGVFDVETIHSRFGMIPRMLPTPIFPQFEWKGVIHLIPDACSIALLGGIESLLSAMVGDNLTGHKHKSNCELVAQGFANLGSVIFGGIPATGTIARTATNIHSGAQTPFAGMIHALTLLMIMLFCSSLVGLIPMAALSAVLMVVAWNLAEPHRFIQSLKASKIEVAVTITTFSMVVLTNLLTGVMAGMWVWGAAQLFQRWKKPAPEKIDQ